MARDLQLGLKSLPNRLYKSVEKRKEQVYAVYERQRDRLAAGADITEDAMRQDYEKALRLK